MSFPQSLKATYLAAESNPGAGLGQPKGVMVEHRGVIRLVLNTDYVQLGGDDVVAQASTTSFDAATFEIWGALLTGARVAGIAKERLISQYKKGYQSSSDTSRD